MIIIDNVEKEVLNCKDQSEQSGARIYKKIGWKIMFWKAVVYFDHS